MSERTVRTGPVAPHGCDNERDRSGPRTGVMA
jgi:hypothetical protein